MVELGIRISEVIWNVPFGFPTLHRLFQLVYQTGLQDKSMMLGNLIFCSLLCNAISFWVSLIFSPQHNELKGISNKLLTWKIEKSFDVVSILE